MYTKIYVDNLAEATTEADLLRLFSPYGNVSEVHIAVKRLGNKPRGFGFVTIVTLAGAHAAIQALNGTTMGTCTLIVSEAWPREGPDGQPGHGSGGSIVNFRNRNHPTVQ